MLASVSGISDLAAMPKQRRLARALHKHAKTAPLGAAIFRVFQSFSGRALGNCFPDLFWGDTRKHQIFIRFAKDFQKIGRRGGEGSEDFQKMFRRCS